MPSRSSIRSLKLDSSSLAGYVAGTGESVMIDDVYDIQSDVDYSFNPDFDRQSNYRTKSMLIVPLKTPRGAVVGVLQLINAKDESGTGVPFSRNDELYLNQFAQYAANAIEKARLAKEMVLRMVDVTSLRDPFETAQHAKRVGAYAVELFEKWATSRHIATEKIARMRESYWDVLCRQVAEGHHEHWDGSGYPGAYRVTDDGEILFGPGKRGTDIPWCARIVAIADVYDALRSERVYKDAWSQDEMLAYLDENSGRYFDPNMVGIFLDMQHVVESIRKKYSY